MMGLTEQQHRCLEAIGRYQVNHGGVSPSYTDLAAMLGVTSKGRIHQLIYGLEQRGRIRRLSGKHRAIELVDQRSKPLVHYTNAAYMVWNDEEQRLVPWTPRKV